MQCRCLPLWSLIITMETICWECLISSSNASITATSTMGSNNPETKCWPETKSVFLTCTKYSQTNWIWSPWPRWPKLIWFTGRKRPKSLCERPHEKKRYMLYVSNDTWHCIVLMQNDLFSYHIAVRTEIGQFCRSLTLVRTASSKTLLLL